MRLPSSEIGNLNKKMYLCSRKKSEKRKDIIMALVTGIKIKRASTGVSRFVTIDLRKHTDFIPLLEKKGVEIDEPVKWTAKMKRSFAQAKNGEVYTRSLEDVLNCL
jgi:hypothetical protein